jgi:broad specificity phosphatase PhoE
MTTTLHLVRHAEVESAYQGVFGGRIDMNLSPRGQEQAIALADFLRRKNFENLYASPMKRVQQTLAPLLQYAVPRPVILPELYEVDFGDWTGLSFEEVKKNFGFSAHEWLHLLDRGDIPNGENVQGYRARINSCLQEILRRTSGQSAAVFCHGGVIRMLLSLLLHLPFAEMDRFEIEYTSITTVVLKPERTRIELLNFTPWRDLKS